MKKIYIILSGLAFLFIIFGCKNNKFSYKVSTSGCGAENNGTTNKVSIKNIKVYLETSKSMKGYINPKGVGDSGYIIKKIVPYLITDLQHKIVTPELYTINSSPTRYKKSIQDFNKSLFNGTLLNGGSTHIDKIFKTIIKDNDSVSGISFLISDCILDIGDNNGQKDQVESAIYDILNKYNASALLFQYYSEFNGDWYYNRNSWERPFLNKWITMHKRPFYIWALGSPRNLSILLNRKILKNYRNSFTYGVKLSQIDSLQLISGSNSGRIYLSNNDQFTLFHYKQGDTAKFAIGINLSKYPGYIQNVTYLENNLKADNLYVKKKVTFSVFKKNSYLNITQKKYQSKKADKIAGELNNFTHVLEVSINNLNPATDTSFSISLYEKEPTWIKNANIRDDVKKTAKQLEGKTYAFNIITDAFKDKFLTSNHCVFKINFKKIN